VQEDAWSLEEKLGAGRSLELGDAGRGSEKLGAWRRRMGEWNAWRSREMFERVSRRMKDEKERELRISLNFVREGVRTRISSWRRREVQGVASHRWTKLSEMEVGFGIGQELGNR